jgi:hypothetical protein
MVEVEGKEKGDEGEGREEAEKKIKNSDVFTLPPFMHYSEQPCTDFF